MKKEEKDLKKKLMWHVDSPNFKLKNIDKHDRKRKEKKKCGMVDCHMSIFFFFKIKTTIMSSFPCLVKS